MIDRLLVSQVFGVSAEYVTYALCDDIIGSAPAYAPILTWLIISLFVL